MTNKNILIILANPARERKSFGEVLALAYQKEAEAAGYHTELIKLASLKFDPILHEGYAKEQILEPDILSCQKNMLEADHWVIIYPLWQFMVPALLKGFLERTLISGPPNRLTDPLIHPLKKKTIRLIQTMGMPEIVYRLYFFQHGAKALKSIFGFIGFHSIRMSYCGLIEGENRNRRARYIKRIERLGSLGI